MFLYRNNNLLNKFVTGLVMMAMLMTTFASLTAPREAHAGGIVYDPTNWIQNNITALNSISMAQKELFWDGIFYAAAKVFLRGMVSSIITWINSGFDGSPAFVSDLDGFLRNVADQAIGDFIYNDPALSFLCTPFQLDVRIALAVQYNESRPGNYQPQCTLSDITDNVEGFLGGDFSQGGWGSMIELVRTPTNNPVGARLDAEGEALIRIIDNQGQEITKLGFGDGFFSMEICDIAEFESGTSENCVIGTPGSTIANSLNKALGAGQDELISADEVNEIFVALFSQLAQQTLEGVFGLLGVGGNAAYADSSYGFGDDATFLEAIQELEEENALDTRFVGDNIPMQTSLDFELEYQGLLNEIITRVDAAERSYNQTEADLAAEGCTLDFEFPTTLELARSDAEGNLALSEGREAELLDIIAEFEAAVTVDDQLEAVARYETLEDSGVLRTSTDNFQTQQFIANDVIPQIRNLESDLAAARADCGI